MSAVNEDESRPVAFNFKHFCFFCKLACKSKIHGNVVVSVVDFCVLLCACMAKSSAVRQYFDSSKKKDSSETQK
jgi:hypothetical protein